MLATGLGAACALAQDLTWTYRIRDLRDFFWRALQERFGDRIVLNGHSTHPLPNTLNVSFVDRIGAEVLAALDDVVVSVSAGECEPASRHDCGEAKPWNDPHARRTSKGRASWGCAGSRGWQDTPQKTEVLCRIRWRVSVAGIEQVVGLGRRLRRRIGLLA